jgi:glycogen operon protein
MTQKLLPSQPFPLGAHWRGDGTHFAVFSAHAEKMQLCLFDGSGRRELARFDFTAQDDGVWHGFLPADVSRANGSVTASPGTKYGYRAYGPYDPALGQRFNGNKLLLDPYARQLSGSLAWHDALFGFTVDSPRTDLSFDPQDSAPYMPKGVICDDRFDWGDDRPPHVPWSDTIIYEMHVRGFTRLRSDLPESMRGTFLALGQPSTIDYLQRLGVTAIELLPIHAFVRDRNLIEQGLTNYWGYNTLSYFVPDAAYLTAPHAVHEMKWAIKQLHAAGIEVLLDVVYNHTAEGSELGPTLSLRGLDNASYYRLLADDPRFYVNYAGCGNVLDFSHPRVIQLTLDSLRYWVQEFHVDGFRFDLCTVLGREHDHFDPRAGFFDALLQDPVLAGVKLIAEPWDIGPGGYQVGNHPPRFAEWNSEFRDSVRRFWRGDERQRGTYAASLQGSAHLFEWNGRKPWASVNFVTAHDGFTLQDLVSYQRKHNDANGEGNRDGSDHSFSSNGGVEGDTDAVAVLAARARRKRNLLASLLCAHGTPMLLAGDEFGQTQLGNNNAYCQDNPLAWLDWKLAETTNGIAETAFVTRLLQLRREMPLLRSHYFQHAVVEVVPGLADVFWFDESGAELQQSDWNNPVARLLGLQRAGTRDDGNVDIVLLLSNSDDADHDFHLPLPNLSYRIAIDTQTPTVGDVALATAQITVAANSLVLLVAHTARAELMQATRAAPTHAI